jgi:hypothetical protein
MGSTEQIPIFSLIWKEQINFAREEGIREDRPMELMFEVAELRAEIAKELAEGPSDDDDLTTTIRNSDQRSLITYESAGCMTSTLSGLLPPPLVKMVEPACLPARTRTGSPSLTVRASKHQPLEFRYSGTAVR